MCARSSSSVWMRALTGILVLSCWGAAAFSVLSPIQSLASRGLDGLSPRRITRSSIVLCSSRCAVSRDNMQSRREVIPSLAFSLAGASFLLHSTPGETFAENDSAVWTPDTKISLEGGKVRIPVLGFGTYNTKPDEVTKAILAAIDEGMRGFDCAAAYGNQKQVGQAIKQSGVVRNELCLTTKVPNEFQKNPKESVLRSIQDLNAEYLDVVLVHSPLTEKSSRLRCFEGLLACKEEGLVRSVGTANFGVSALSEISSAGLPSPSLNELELSPFNQRKGVVEWCRAHDTAVSSGSWSKLSNKETGAKNWPKLKEVAASKGITPQQVLIAWSLQRQLLCNPRAAAENDKDIETIRQNFSGMRGVALSPEQLATVDALDEGLLSGSLGRRDGWADKDVAGPEWDPTLL